jgi:CubicO group peptidase (beta-lactamase class C family)
VLVERHGRVVYFEAFGKNSIENGAPMTKDSLFRIYSMTKPITAVAAMTLYEEGKFQLTDPVSKFIPELKGLKVLKDGREEPAASEMTMQQLLSHTAGFAYGFNAWDPVDKRYQDDKLLVSKDLNEFIAKLAKLPLRNEPGTKWQYSVAVDVTGAVIERISGQRLDRFMKERLFDPLKMDDTFFDVPEAKLARLGSNHRWDAEQNKLVVLPDGGYPVYRNTTFFSGGGGLVSSTTDYARFAEMLRNGGSLDGARVLSPKTIELMTMNHLPATAAPDKAGESPGITTRGFEGSGFGLGFGVVDDVPKSGIVGSKGEYSWGGAAGTVFWVDPVEELVVVGMIQLMGSPWPLRSELKTLTYQALTELEPRCEP